MRADERIAACLGLVSRVSIWYWIQAMALARRWRNNYQLLVQQASLLDYQLPLLVGMSRKSMIGNPFDRPVAERLAGVVWPVP